ncbi:hypothetical protein [Geminicoccus flavidas]|uniref:hypothetical protein n=1 Tax=Geminicoccus flavidas TaxID=2506407 RepID=UPI00190F0CCB|nr:hypothetical protein [Geminicoccus flavidas]
MDLLSITNRIKFALAWRRVYLRVQAELSCYTEREMKADLGLNRSDIPKIAAKAADQHTDKLVRQQVDPCWGWQDFRRLAHS